MDRKYNLRLDLQFRCNNSIMKFDEFDNNTSDFFIRVTKAGELIDISKAIVTLVVIKPDNSVDAQFVDIDSNRAYCDLKPTMKNIPGKYEAIASITVDGETVNTDIDNPIIYEVTKNKFLRQINEEVKIDERFTILTDMINRLSSIETNENTRIENENSRAESEKIREQAIEKIKNDTTKLIADTKKEIADYKSAKDTAINDDLAKYKQDTTQSIDNYKSAKDTEINETLNEYKSSATDDIEGFKNTKSQELDDFKNTKNSEIDDYKKEKDLAINQYVENKNLALNEYVTEKNSEIDKYKEAKDKEIDLYKSNKDTLINNKISEVEAAKQNIISTANNKISELDQAKINMQNDVNSKLEEADNRITELQNFESQLEQIENKNIEQDTRLKQVEYKNKVQDVYIQGLFSENKDGRLTLEGEGNSLKLEGSKEGLVTVDKIVGNTMFNLRNYSSKVFSNNVSIDDDGFITITGSGSKFNNFYMAGSLNMFKPSTVYTFIVEIVENTLVNGQINITNKSSEKSDGQDIFTPKMFGSGTTGVFAYAMTTKPSFVASDDNQPIRYVCRSFVQDTNSETGWRVKLRISIFEGDYTSKQGLISPNIEGMQSSFENQLVTQEMVDSGEESVENLGKYKCNVKVKNKNLFDVFNNEYETDKNVSELKITPYKITYKASKNYSSILLVKKFYFEAGKKYTVAIKGNNSRVTGTFNTKTNATPITSNDTKYITFNAKQGDFINYFENAERGACDVLIEGVWVYEGDYNEANHIPYYERTQTVYLNNPLLKGDEIVYVDGELKHYHKMGKVVLDGSEEKWSLDQSNDTYTSFYRYSSLEDYNFDISSNQYCICDKFTTISYKLWKTMPYEGCVDATGNFAFIVANSKLSTLNVAGWKQWLQANPTTVVYELAEPYYETIDTNKLLLEIPNNATLTVESIIPCQSVKATYTGSIPSIYTLEETNANQDNLIDISLMATDEMYMMLEPILEMMPTTMSINERMVSKMVDMYVAMVIRGLKTIEDVPARYRKEVQDILNKLEK
nr:MAG TPA: chromosome segregation ATPase [Caudoviricetes sp.]